MAVEYLSNIGVQIAMSETGVTPLKKDLLMHVVDAQPAKLSEEVISKTIITDPNGYKHKVGGIKDCGDIVMTMVLGEKAEYDRVWAKAKSLGSDESHYFDLTFIYPDNSEFDGCMDKTYHGFISSFEPTKIDGTDIQGYSIVFSCSGAPKEYTGGRITA